MLAKTEQLILPVSQPTLMLLLLLLLL